MLPFGTTAVELTDICSECAIPDPCDSFVVLMNKSLLAAAIASPIIDSDTRISCGSPTRNYAITFGM